VKYFKSPLIELSVGFTISVIGWFFFILHDPDSWVFMLVGFFITHILFSGPTLIALNSHIKYEKNLKIRSIDEDEIVIL